MTNKPIIFISILLLLVAPIALAISNANLGINQKTTVLAIPIMPEEPSPITLDRPGCYKLTGNLTNKQIIIDSDDVTLLINGFSINNPSLAAHAIVVNPGRSDIIIQGGEISGKNISNIFGIEIEDNCSNLLIQNLKIRNEQIGISATATLGNTVSDLLIRQCIISNCLNGIVAARNNSLRVKQCLISAPDLALFPIIAITIALSSVGTTIDSCTILQVHEGIAIAGGSASIVKDCTINDLRSSQNTQSAIKCVLGNSNIIDSCTVNSIEATSNTDYHCIWFDTETASTIRNCVVNNVFASVGVVAELSGIRVSGSDECVVQDNVVENMFGTDVANTSYGYRLDGSSTGTRIFINNRAINCTNPDTQPYTPNIPNVVNAPISTIYPYNWVVS